MKKWTAVAAALVVLASMSSAWAGSACCGGGMKTHAKPATDAAAVKAQEKCPVMDAPVSKAFYADHAGKRVYFCCASCKDAFQKDPETYLKKLEEQGVALEAAPQPAE